MEKYELSMVGNELYNFVWDDFCSWYIELSKATLFSEDADVVKSTKAVLYTVMINILKLLSPFMPFVTEEIYLDLPHEKESLNVETWPEKIDFEKEKAKLSNALEHLEKEIKRSTGMLNNKGFVAKAPAAKVQQEKDKLASYQEQYELTKKQYDELMAKA